MIFVLSPQLFCDIFYIFTTAFLCCVIWSILSNYSKRMLFSKKLPPGPIGFPILGVLPFLGCDPYKTLYRWRKKYGNLIGMYLGSHYTVVLNEYKVAKEVFSCPASLGRTTAIFPILGDYGFGTTSGKSWLEQRRHTVLATKELINENHLWEKIVMDEASTYVEYLKESKEKPIEIKDSLNESLTTTIFHFFIGRKLDIKSEATKIDVLTQFSHKVLAYCSPSSVGMIIPGLSAVLTFLKIAGYDKVTKHVLEFRKLIRDEIKTDSTENKNFIKKYLDELENLRKSGKTDHYFSEKMLEGNLVTLFVAASDTVLSVLIWMLRLMTDHQEVQHKVYKELMDVLGKDGKANFADRDKLPYTSAVIMETLRYSCVVRCSLPRVALQDIDVQGFTIPKGAEITLNIWALHFDPDYWEEPEKFKPERFLTNNGTQLVKNPQSYMPFSYGRRNCVAAKMAEMELLIYFTEIIRNFEVSTVFGQVTDYTLIPGLVYCLDSQPIRFQERIK